MLELCWCWVRCVRFEYSLAFVESLASCDEAVCCVWVYIVRCVSFVDKKKILEILTNRNIFNNK
jgi:hypothetical protein